MSALDSEATVAASTAGRRERTVWEKVARHPAGPVSGLYVVALIVCVVFGLAYPDEFAFLSRENIVVNLRAIPLLGVLGLGVGLLMISGEFDLSVGSAYTLGPMSTALIFAGGEGWPIALAVGLALALAVAVGLVNGLVTLRFGIPSFIATLGMLLFLRGVTRFVSGARAEAFYPGDIMENVLTGGIGVLQAQFLWLVGFAVAAHLLLNYHRFGNHIYAVGGDKAAAISVGVNVTRVKLIAFVMCSVLAVVAGLFSATRVNAVSLTQGHNLELQAIAVCVVGGLFLFGGRGSILGIVVGAAFIYLVSDILLLIRAPGYYFQAFVGAIVITAVAMNAWMARRG